MANTTGVSHPSRGAWIEIEDAAASIKKISSRTPHGVRGLKSHARRAAPLPNRRTPHGVRGLK